MKILLISFSLLVVSCAGVQSRYHRVEQGDTLTKIATEYEVPVAELKRYNTDLLAKGLTPGSKLYLPFEESPRWAEEEVEARRVSRSPADGTATASFNWPVQGLVSSPFGKRWKKMHEGVDIAARKGTPVKASRSGHVIYATNRISGYGNMVILRHADTFSTVYAHLSRIAVRKGQFVRRGQSLGSVGRTGHATGPHLHFEVRNQQTPVDPLLYLQGQFADNKIGSR